MVGEFHPKEPRERFQQLWRKPCNECTASHCIRAGKRIVKRALPFTGDCQKRELAETEEEFTQFHNLLVNNSLAITVAIKHQTSFSCSFIFQPAKMELANPFLEIFHLILISLSSFHPLQLSFYFQLHTILHSFLSQPQAIIALLFSDGILLAPSWHYHPLCRKKHGPRSIMLLIGFWPSHSTLPCLFVRLISSSFHILHFLPFHCFT